MTEYPKHFNSQGEKRDSKSEIIIEQEIQRAELSYEYGVRFGPYVVDFVISHNNTVYYWEHLGLLDDPQYQERWEKKKRWYISQGIWNKVITTIDHNGSIDVRDINSAILKIKGIDSREPDDNISDHVMEKSRMMNTIWADCTLSATYDPNARSYHSNNVILRLMMNRNMIPRGFLNVSFTSLEVRGGLYVVRGSNEGNKFTNSGSEHKMVLRVTHGSSQKEQFYHLLREFCLNHVRISPIATKCSFVTTPNDEKEIHISIPAPDERLRAVRNNRKGSGKKSTVSAPEPEILTKLLEETEIFRDEFTGQEKEGLVKTIDLAEQVANVTDRLRKNGVSEDFIRRMFA